MRSRRQTPRMTRGLRRGRRRRLFVLLALSFGASVRAGQRPADAWAWVLGVLLTAPYTAVRRAPWVALGVTLAALVAFSLLALRALSGLSVFVLIFGIALHGTRRDSLAALAAVVRSWWRCSRNPRGSWP